MVLRTYGGYSFYVYHHPSSPTGYVPLVESLNSLLQCHSTDTNMCDSIKALKHHLDRTLDTFALSNLRLSGKTYRRDTNVTTSEKRKVDLPNQTFLTCADFISLLQSKVTKCPPQFHASILGLANNVDFHVGYIQCHLTKMEWLKRQSNLQNY